MARYGFNTQLQIVSLNRENANGTWSGRLSSAIGDVLLKIEIDEGVDLERLTRDEYVFVDAVVTYRQDINSASLIPQSILVTDVHDDDSHHYADDHVRNYRESAAITAADVQRVQKKARAPTVIALQKKSRHKRGK